ncbi:unnamed protein product [Rotaria sp. Silwood2]|nr:unnamed protein product [Rotaria sp. Silwood2]CAF4186804.1 unnamed protein product [Rotaria sp. Silwood2]
MPREERSKCVTCSANIGSNRKYFAGDGLWKLFLSARSLKRINKDDSGCNDCRMKYLNWLKKIEGDFNHFRSCSEVGDSKIEDDMEIDADYNNSEGRVEIGAQTELESNASHVSIAVKRCTKSHRSCIVCGLRDQPAKVLSKQQRMLIFIKRGILIPNGCHCCHDHFYNRQISFDALDRIRADQVDQLVCNADRLQEILNDFRLMLESQKTFDSDDPYSLNDKDYYNITSLRKGRLNINKISSYLILSHAFIDQFENVFTRVESMRNSKLRSIRVAIAIFCAKMRLGLSNHVLATMFHIHSKRAVSRIVHQVNDTLLKDFVPAHLGFKHISRQSVLENHQAAIANALLTDNNQQVVVVVMNGTYLYLQKSADNELQRRTYSMHKYRHLVKPMVITITNGYILNVFGPFFGDDKINDANIIKHCLLNNEQDILKWLHDDDIILLDRGFRDAIPTIQVLGFRVSMPSFLNGKAQLSTEEANKSRLVTANRWVIDSSEY